MTWLLGALAVALMFLFLVAPHEGGHFAFAKLFGVTVKEFSVGMGTRLVSGTRGGTLYAFRLLPIGGYVRLNGMEPGDDFSDPDGFHQKPAWQRLLVLFGGPLANFVVAALVMTVIYGVYSQPHPGRIQGVVAGSPAAAAGLQAGDEILTVNGAPVNGREDIVSTEAKNPGQPLQLTVRRAAGSTARLTVTPQLDEKTNAYLIGIYGVATLYSPSGAPIHNWADALVNGPQFPVQAAVQIVGGFGALISGAIPGGVLGPQGATGPIGIAAMTAQQAQYGVADWFALAAALSVALGFANLLPLPALDGGRVVVVLLEVLRRRPFDRERELAVQRYGLVALLALIAFIAYFDIQRLVNHQFPGMK